MIELAADLLSVEPPSHVAKHELVIVAHKLDALCLAHNITDMAQMIELNATWARASAMYKKLMEVKPGAQ